MSSEALERAKHAATIATAAERLIAQDHFEAPYADAALAARDALLAEVARLEQELSLLDRNATVWHADDCGVHNANPPWRCTCDGSVLRAALAVAREREQRAVKTLKKYGSHSESCKRYQHDWRIRFRNAEPTCLCGFRAALVDEPAAATLAEPDQGTGPGGSAQPSRRQSGANIPSGSASAAADEPGETPA